jgi:hypothetical protein
VQSECFTDRQSTVALYCSQNAFQRHLLRKKVCHKPYHAASYRRPFLAGLPELRCYRPLGMSRGLGCSNIAKADVSDLGLQKACRWPWGPLVGTKRAAGVPTMTAPAAGRAI